MRLVDAVRRRFHRVRAEYRSARELGPFAPLRFRSERRSADYRRAYETDEPLVSILITTYNRARLLRERSVESLLRQTYRNIEIIVVGDCCTDETDAVMRAVTDPRVTWLNLPERGRYPQEPELRWMVAGAAPFNKALTMARGDFISHLDDDDEHAPDRVEKLVRFVKETQADLVYHPFLCETPDGEWQENRASEFALNSVTTSAILYHRWFLRIPADAKAYRYPEPGDWNRLRKFRFLGARIRRYPEALLSHFRERNQARPPVSGAAAEALQG